MAQKIASGEESAKWPERTKKWRQTLRWGPPLHLSSAGRTGSWQVVLDSSDANESFAFCRRREAPIITSSFLLLSLFFSSPQLSGRLAIAPCLLFFLFLSILSLPLVLVRLFLPFPLPGHLAVIVSVRRGELATSLRSSHPFSGSRRVRPGSPNQDASAPFLQRRRQLCRYHILLPGNTPG